MADVVISALVSDVVSKLANVAIQEFGLLTRLNSDVYTLRTTYNQIQAVLHDAEIKQRGQKDVEEWLRRLRSVSLEVENILDDLSTEVMIQKLHNERGIKHKVRAFFAPKHNRLIVHTRIAHKVKNICRKLDGVAANKTKFELTPSVHVGIVSKMPNRETSSLVHKSMIYGRDEEMEMIAEKICNENIGMNDVRVYAIWGMGGVGKTTLAQLVYNHGMVKKHFELKSWVYVSNEFGVKNLMGRIIKSLGESYPEDSQLDVMQICIQDKLKGKRFCIVLDDVWIDNKDMAEWEELSKALSCGAEGSVVIVTRNETASKMMAKVLDFQHKVRYLSDRDSWSLFKKLAFADGRQVENVTVLEPIGMQIVDKCKGFPLAVKTLGGLMWSKSSTNDWEHVRDSNLWELQENDILPALKLSYDNLLPHLKRCFAYCSLFSKGCEMSKDLLIELWMANGFIPPRGEVDLYVLGEEIFDCLVWSSFFEDVKKHTNMDKICKMHDLMHDLGSYVMRHDCSVIGLGKESITTDEVLHLSSSCLKFLFVSTEQNLAKLRSLRSILIFANQYRGSIKQISNYAYLRVLYLDQVDNAKFPESICKLKHLRYLKVSNSNIEFLPESIIYLQNLQVLLLKSCRKLQKLPQGMRFLRNLQHLDISSCNELLFIPVGIKELTSLRRLSNFVVGKTNGALIGELGDLNRLGWELELSGLENVGGLGDAKSANLKYKNNVLHLRLCWSGIYAREKKLEVCLHDEEVLEGLEPSSSLKELIIKNYFGKISPSWLFNLENLVAIEFSGCENYEHIPQLGKLPNLKTLSLRKMDSLKCFHDDDDDNIIFPALQKLFIHMSPNLVSVGFYNQLTINTRVRSGIDHVYNHRIS